MDCLFSGASEAVGCSDHKSHRVCAQKLFLRVEMSNSRGRRLNVTRGKLKRDMIGKFFLHRMVVPRDVVEADAKATFKRHLDGHKNRWDGRICRQLGLV